MAKLKTFPDRKQMVLVATFLTCIIIVVFVIPFSCKYILKIIKNCKMSIKAVLNQRCIDTLAAKERP